MLRRLITLALVCACCFSLASCLDSVTTVPVKVTVYDRNLNVKPVPEFALIVERKGAATHAQANGNSAPFGGKKLTAADGTVAFDLLPGKYVIRSESPRRFDGCKFAWRHEFEVTGAGGETLELSYDNADVSDDEAATPDCPGKPQTASAAPNAPATATTSNAPANR